MFTNYFGCLNLADKIISETNIKVSLALSWNNLQTCQVFKGFQAKTAMTASWGKVDFSKDFYDGSQYVRSPAVLFWQTILNIK